MSKINAMPSDRVICPICASKLQQQSSSLVCRNSHCFDIARQGYVNFLLQAPKEKYNKRLFQSRARISQAGAFRGLTDRLGELVQQKLQQGDFRRDPTARRHSTAILDAGCGEGSHLTSLLRQFAGRIGSQLFAAGIDISKEGIRMAAKSDPEVMWGVADLAKCPFAEQSFDFIINILSPANYAEFHRMLTAEGFVLKVIPGKEYLQEIRQTLYDKTERRLYSNNRTIALFRRHFELTDMERVRYEVTLDQEHFMHLLRMTPLAWQASEEQIQQMTQISGGVAVTFDFDILMGKK